MARTVVNNVAVSLKRPELLDGGLGGSEGGASEVSPFQTEMCRSLKPQTQANPQGGATGFPALASWKGVILDTGLQELGPWSCSGRNSPLCRLRSQRKHTGHGPPCDSAAPSLCWANAGVGVMWCLIPPSIPPSGVEGLQGNLGPLAPAPASSLPTGCLNCSKVLELSERLKVLEAKVGEQLSPPPGRPSPSLSPHTDPVMGTTVQL